MSEIRVDNITDEAGTGAPGFPNGITATGAALTDPEITGGIYLGGTGSANYLEDYEEGTWTPTLGFIEVGPSAGSESFGYANYTKIGNMVTLRFLMNFNDSTDVSIDDRWSVDGLPFTAEGDTLNPIGTFWLYDNFSRGENAFGHIGHSGSGARIFFYVTHTDSPIDFTGPIQISAMYKTNS